MNMNNSVEKFGPIRKHAEKIGNQLIDAFVLAALFVLGGTIVWSAGYAYLGMMDQVYGSISDILLLFIYLELGAMVGIYFKSGRIPVQFLIFIAITVLTRMLASVTVVDMSNMRILVIVSAILLLCIAVLVLWYSEDKVRREEIRFLAHLGNRPDQGFRQTTSSGMMRFSTTLRTEFFSLSSASSPMTTLGLKIGSPSAAMRARVRWWISIMAAV